MTLSQLNMSWTVAPANARLNSFRLPDCAMETIVLVTLVPIFAPMIIGMAGPTSITEEKKGKKLLTTDTLLSVAMLVQHMVTPSEQHVSAYEHVYMAYSVSSL